MIEVLHKNIFETKCKCLVNPVNSIGVMGAGLAKELKTRFPNSCQKFNQDSVIEQKKYFSPILLPPVYHKSDSLFDDGIDILFFPTKIHWKNPSKLEYIEKNLPIALSLLENNFVPSVAFPFLGCGLGGLHKSDVLKLFLKYQNLYLGKIEIYENFFEQHSKRNY